MFTASTAQPLPLAIQPLLHWAEYLGWYMVPLALACLFVLGLLSCWIFPYAMLRLAMAGITRSILWLRKVDTQHVPTRGPVLLVANPLSYLGWLIILAACPRRIRFVWLAGWTGCGIPGWLLRQAGAIVPRRQDQAAIDEALATAALALGRGEVICLFAEGCKVNGKTLLTFEHVYSQVKGDRPVPVLPVCLQQPHGSLFTMYNGRFVRKLPPELPSPVWVRFGTVLPEQTSAWHARQALQILSAQLAIDRVATTRPVHRQFVRMAARHPFRPCLIDSTAPGQDLSYAKTYVGGVCLAKVLRPLLAGESLAAVWLPPGRGSALTNLALALLGKTSVNLNYTTGSDAVQSALRQCSCRFVITAKRFTARMPVEPGPGVELIYLEDLLPKVSGTQKLFTLLSVILLPGWFLVRFVLKLGQHCPADLATIIFSSGSTGEPKGVMLTHGNVAANAESMIQATNLGPSDRVLGVLPFFHSFGYTVTFWSPLQVGAAGVYHPDPRQAREIGELSRKHSCTVYLSTATFLRFCLKKCDAADFRSIRILVCGAEKLPPSLAEEFERRFGILPIEGYGCTELSPVVAANMPDQPFGDLVQIYNRTGSVGAPLPGIAGRLVHPDTREVLAGGPEVDGLLEVTGANVMQGYLHKPDLTREVVRDGWYATGDMARIDSNGHIIITGRMSRFAKIGGEMVPLEKIEEALHDVLGATDRLCSVTCVPDDLRGERLIVLYIADALAPFGLEIRPWTQRLTLRGFPNLWVPGERDFYAVPELPVLGTGKLNLKGVKDLAMSLARR